MINLKTSPIAKRYLGYAFNVHDAENIRRYAAELLANHFHHTPNVYSRMVTLYFNFIILKNLLFDAKAGFLLHTHKLSILNTSICFLTSHQFP